MSGLEASLVRFGAFELELRTAVLRKDGGSVKLQAQPCKLLTLLLSRAGDVVTREEIRRRVWERDARINFDQGINACMKLLRAALGDRGDPPRFIETVPRQGYRFLVPVELAGGPPPAVDASGDRRIPDVGLPDWTFLVG